MERRFPYLAAFGLILAAVAAPVMAGAPDGVDVTLTLSPETGEITLTWVGGQPIYQVFRSTSPVDIDNPVNKLGETSGASWSDTPPPGQSFYYRVTSPCVVNPPEICDGVDNDCDGQVDESDGGDICVLDNATATCTAGNCMVEECGSGYGDCDLDSENGCESDLARDDLNCGTCGTVCSFANASGSCELGGCRLDVCDAGFDDCDLIEQNGCEVDLSSDATHCGSCGNVCSFTNGSGECQSGGCALASCDLGFDDCDLDAQNGCESDVDSDALNCGACGNTCAFPNATAACVGSTCEVSGCLPDFWDINGDAADGCEYACTFISPTDEPDPAFVDANCDGIDGDRATAIFVATTGNDGHPGTAGLPKQSIQAALAAASPGVHLIVDQGDYLGSLLLVDGVGIHGGYDRGNGWSRSPGNLTRVLGGSTAIQASDLALQTVLELLTVEASSSGSDGVSSIGVLANDSPGLWIRWSEIRASNGGGGADGPGGNPGSPGSVGARGSGGCEDSGGFCSSCSQPGAGTGGVSTCGAGNGGRGGAPGKDTSNGSPGGSGGGGTPGGNGLPDGMGNWNPTGGLGGNGLPGANGADGVTGYLRYDGSGLLPIAGFLGEQGEGGNGGGGGGGGGGGSTSCDSYGGRGGGGGSGGCGGGAGQGGNSAGGSIAVYLWNSDARVESSTLISADGGVGGNGGNGANGGLGGLGGNCGGTKGNCYGGSSEQDDGSNGARGGRGGIGGRGGDGGGGSGGPSFGLYVGGRSLPVLSGLSYVTGNPGAGGLSGNPGPQGPSGGLYSSCGNGIVEPDEDCDDGNRADGDGCDVLCHVESGESCAGTPSACNPIGQVVVAHAGATDPETEGWSRLQGNGTSSAALMDDRELDAWTIVDGSTNGGSTFTYLYTPTPAEVAAASGAGWLLRSQMRIGNTPDPHDLSVYMEYANGTTRWGVGFGSTVNGDPIVGFLGGPTVPLTVTRDGYHLYEVVFDPDQGTADLFVDGEEVISNNAGQPLALTRVIFGSGQSSGTGTSHWSSVEWTILSCGNGFVDPGEQCDDGGLVDGDGCSRVCSIE